MNSLQRLFIVWALIAAGATGCAGYRGGWESVAYIGDVPPASAGNGMSSDTAQRSTLDLPGLNMTVGIDNQLRTYDTQVYLFALPLSIDPRKVYPKNNEPGKTRVYVTVTPSETGFVFRPGEAVLQVADKRIVGASGYEFGMWDRDGKAVKEGGAWAHRPVGSEFGLAEPGRRYYLSIDFNTPVPSPESPDIAIDLSRALVSPQRPPVPLIRFAPVRWKEGYT